MLAQTDDICTVHLHGATYVAPCSTTPYRPLLLHAGHVPLLLSPKGPWALLKWAHDYGPIFKVAFAPYGVGVVLSDPATIARVTRKTGTICYIAYRTPEARSL